MVSGIVIDTKHGEKFAIFNHSALPLAGSRIGYYRVHDMFSRIFGTRICEFSHQYLLVELNPKQIPCGCFLSFEQLNKSKYTPIQFK